MRALKLYIFFSCLFEQKFMLSQPKCYLEWKMEELWNGINEESQEENIKVYKTFTVTGSFFFV